jgi:hypothetical protein
MGLPLTSARGPVSDPGSVNLGLAISLGEQGPRREGGSLVAGSEPSTATQDPHTRQVRVIAPWGRADPGLPCWLSRPADFLLRGPSARCAAAPFSGSG